jgi:Carboxypeptidase regulatory-like domain/TonB-dependent Receptor Plug Domain
MKDARQSWLISGLARTCIVASLGIALAHSSYAQSTTGTILGTVVDKSGAVIPNAKVTIRNIEKGTVARVVTTDHNGNYQAPTMPVGTYSVTVSAAGFADTTENNVPLDVQDRRFVKIQLAPAGVNTEVSVNAEAVQVNTQDASAGGTITAVQIQNLALQSRNYEELVALQPGVTSDISGTLYLGVSAPGGTTNEVAFSLNGSQGAQNYWTIDGADNVDRGGNFTLLNYPSVDAISEFKVLRGNYDAEYGRGAGGQINVITRTNKFHGNLYEFFRNDVLDANTWENKQVSPAIPRTPLRYNDFGGTIGGPVIIPKVYNGRDRTFFFFSEEVRRVNESSPSLSLVPNAQERGANPTFPTPVCLDQVSTVDGVTCSNFSNTIPSNLVSPAAAAYLTDVYSHVPLPQDPTTDLLRFNQVNQFNFHQEIIRLDHTFNQKFSGFLRYMNDSIPTIEGGGLFNGNSVPNIAQTTTNSPGHNAAASVTMVFSPTLVNQLEYAWSWGAVLSTNSGQLAASASPNVVSAIRLPYPVTLNRIPSIGFGQSQASFFGFGNYNDYNRNHSVFDNLTKVVGLHTLRFGFLYNNYQKSENSGGNNAGTFSFDTGLIAPDVDPNDSRAQWSQQFANFLLGNASSFSQLSQDIQAVTRQNQLEFYGQDTYRIKPNLTLSYGLRYSLFKQPYDAKGHATNFVPSLYNPAQAPAIDASGNICVVGSTTCDTSNGPVTPNPNYNPLNGIIIGGVNSPYGSHIAPSSTLAFAPRVGIAWDPWADGKTSIRAGYGIFYDAPAVGPLLENNVFINPPFVSEADISSAPFADPAAGQTAPPTPSEIGGTSTHWHQPYTQQYNLDIQRQMPGDILFDIGYYGSTGRHLIAAVDINQPAPGALPFQLSADNDTLLNAVRPFVGYGPIGVYQPIFSSNYNSLQVSAQKRFATTTVAVNYTWSKNLTDLPNDPVYSFPQDSRNLRSEYGPSRFDRRHVLNINFVYPIPGFRDQRGFAGHLLGGWEFSGILQFQSGAWLTATTATDADTGNLGLFTSSALAYNQRPDQTADPNLSAPHTVAQWFNTAAFSDVPADQVRPGNAPRASILGPGFQQENFALMKNFRIYEQSSLQFRVEAFNAFNHTSFSTIDTQLGSSTYGQVIGAHEPRILQLALKFSF